MAELLEGSMPKIIPFYLPQFHEIPENNKWWGEGFTEWTNLKKAAPLFEGHNQPRVPENNNYYNLLDDNVKIWQAELAKKHGIFGFCYYHYWFKDGKKLLEKPAEQMLQNKKIDLPFCFSWANENWSRNWDGGNSEIIMSQEYGNKSDWEKHFNYLLPFFKDDRYITYEGKPIFIIYKPEQIIDIKRMVRYFKERAVEEGFPGLYCGFQFPTYYNDMYYDDSIFDFRIGFEPTYSRNPLRDQTGTAPKIALLRKLHLDVVVNQYRKKNEKKAKKPRKQSTKLNLFDYDEAWSKILSNKWADNFWPGAFVDWDNTPRNKKGVVYTGQSVEKFGRYMEQLVRRARKENKICIFINAWNEWCEGAYLEPDVKDSLKKLEALKRIINVDSR